MGAESLAVVVGLGNPDRQYSRNRHNVGFMVLDKLTERLGLTVGGRSDQWQVAGAEAVRLVKPLTYMNRSGEALVAWAEAEGVRLTGRPEAGPESGSDVAETLAGNQPLGIRPLVVCDDLALPLGSVRLRARGSSGGQNGLASVIEQLGGQDLPRLRLGIAPLAGAVPPAMWADYVLADFEADETEAAAEMIEHAAAAIDFWLTEGLEATISRFNRRVHPVD